MKMKDFIDNLPPYMLSFGAVVSFVLIIVFAWQDNMKAAALLAGIFVVCVILAYVPQLDSLKAFTIDAKFRRNLDRADEILARIKELSIANARTTYMTFAWANRMGEPTAKDKQAVLDAFDDQLNLLKVSAEEQLEIKRPYVRLIGADLWGLYRQIMERFVQWKDAKLHEGTRTPEVQAAMQQFVFDVAEWRQASSSGPYSKLETYDLEVELKRATPEKFLDETNRPGVVKFRNDVLTLFLGCREKGGFTKEAADFVDSINNDGNQLGGVDRKMKEVFGIPKE